ncbi:hypothetical protein YC2023_108326 [Brassica napus]
MVDSEDRYSTEKASSVQSAILYNLEVLPRVSSEPRVQISRSSARYSAGSPKNCPEARGGSVRVQISLSRPVSFFMVKPRSVQVEISSVQSSQGVPWVPVIFKDSFSAGGWTIWAIYAGLLYVRDPPILGLYRVTRRTVGCRAVTRRTVGRGRLKVPSSGLCECRRGLWNPRVSVAPIYGVTSSDIKVVDIKAMRFPLLEARSWQEAKSNLVTVALGRAQSWIILCRGHGVKFVTLTGLSLARHVALLDHGVGLDGQSCSCLIVGWPVGLSSPTLGVGRPSVMFLFDCWPVGRPMLRTVRGRSDTVLVSTINDADQGSADVAFRTPLEPYEKSKFLGSGGSMVARLKLKGIDGRAPPGVEPAA